MGSQKYENGGESQSLLIMNDPIISTRTRTADSTEPRHQRGGERDDDSVLAGWLAGHSVCSVGRAQSKIEIGYHRARINRLP
jgi:hypothetical protein